MKYCTPTRATIIARQQREAELADRPNNDRKMAALIAKIESERLTELDRRLNVVPIHHWLGIKLARLALSRANLIATSARPRAESGEPPIPVQLPDRILVDGWPVRATMPSD